MTTWLPVVVMMYFSHLPFRSLAFITPRLARRSMPAEWPMVPTTILASACRPTVASAPHTLPMSVARLRAAIDTPLRSAGSRSMVTRPSLSSRPPPVKLTNRGAPAMADTTNSRADTAICLMKDCLFLISNFRFVIRFSAKLAILKDSEAMKRLLFCGMKQIANNTEHACKPHAELVINFAM